MSRWDVAGSVSPVDQPRSQRARDQIVEEDEGFEFLRIPEVKSMFAVRELDDECSVRQSILALQLFWIAAPNEEFAGVLFDEGWNHRKVFVHPLAAMGVHVTDYKRAHAGSDLSRLWERLFTTNTRCLSWQASSRTRHTVVRPPTNPSHRSISVAGLAWHDA